MRIQKGGGVLIIATDGATSTEMEYMKTEIIKKINDYYGYRAINRVRFRNTIIHEKVLTKKRKNTSQLKKHKKKFSFDEIEEGELKEAINSLGDSMLNKINK